MGETSSLGEMADLQVGFAFKSSEYSTDPSHARLLRGDNIAQGELRWDRCAYWGGDDVDMRYRLYPGDVVLAMDRPWIDAGLKFASVREEDTPSYLVQRVARLRAKPGTHQRYLHYLIASGQFSSYVLSAQTGTAVPHISGAQILEFRTSRRSYYEQQAIAEVLGALDDKIAAIHRVRRVTGELARTKFAKAAKSGNRNKILDVSTLVTRGITPKYTDSDGVTILNQKCVRKQWVSLDAARVTDSSKTRSSKMLQRDDVLVNSTGFGTLGRTARWIRDIDATVDSHVSIVRFDPNIIDPVCAGFGLLRIENQIESLAEGSTGQTELRRDLLASLEILVPCREDQIVLGKELAELDTNALILEDESRILAKARDELLPLLMSGNIRIRDMERAVEEVV
ncbi:hypothetical protein [Nocardiopsis sp. LDBS1602]|uniref:hypothetical protein n=1 Tax=Nocardiopsis sp. LDBS1602 TaxID=3109597 RepID=UPI002DBC9ED6|nr:hypothetical protein [Nocardiopsis sp. LDBS1602]MEC3894400.1 hypothetical protein [Nocardiopsis sp. LDBS1602]